MRKFGLIASFAVRHAIATGAVFALGCVLWTLLYFVLLVWAVLADAGLGSPVVYPLGLLMLFCGTTITSLLLFLPATLTGELFYRWRALPTLIGIPVAFVFFCLLSFAWAIASNFILGIDDPSAWAMALGIVVVLAVPLGLYWWVAEFANVAWDAGMAAKRFITKKFRQTEPETAMIDSPTSTA